ncbi:MAG TPA: carboxypeptidase regulatory-like domain-containing protein [Vicinamibacterales bacterium]|nr:carboxypeptidase regulatory-like domain-containing protein [Vicinamibacterales bacterium]
MHFNRWLRGMLAVCMLATSAAAAYGQGTTSRVTGTVTDSSGAVIPGASVTLSNDLTGVSFEAVTNASGGYLFEAVQVGTYTITVQLQGFKKFVSSGNRVAIGEPTTINVSLAIGGLEEAVEVRATSQVVQSSTTGNLGTTFDQRTIESLPILGGRGRNPLDLVLTQPGVVSGANTGGGVHVNGARDRSWNFTLDGIDTNESSAGGSNFSPLRTNPDALAEFKVLTGNQTAEYGRNSGGQVAMITRSGNNKFSGTGFYFDRRPKYNANEWENNIDQQPKRNFTQKMPGFSIGGPILRNKTFFFVNSQWLRAEQTLTQTRMVYTDLARRGIFRYVIGGRNRPAGVSGASVDENGNVLPGVNIGTYNIGANDPQGLGYDPEIQRIIGLTPPPNNFTTGDGLNTAGFTFVAPEEEEQFDFVTKIDHNFNNQHAAFVRISKGYQNTNCDSVNGGLERYPGLGCIVNTERSPYNWAGNWRWSPGGTLVNEFVVGQNHFTFDFVIPSSDTSRPTFTGTPITNPETFDVGNLRTIDTWQIVNNLSWLKGPHSIKLGTNIRMQRHTDTRGSVAGQNVGQYVNFSTSVNTVDPATFGIPSDINTQFDRPALQNNINFQLGRVGSISQGFVQQGNAYAPGGTLFNFQAWYHELDFYAQDTWKPRSNVTVDAGIRWEVKLSPSNPENLIRRPNQRVAAGEPPSTTLRWEEGELYDDDWNNFAPSIGIAWDPKNDGKSVLRGNYRMAFDRINTFVLSSAIFQSIPGITTSVVNTAFGQSGGRLLQGLPSIAPTASPGDFLQPPSPSSSLITVVDTEFQTPITHAWAISYQREIFRQALIEVAYVGRRAENLFGAYNANQVEIFDNGFLDAFNVVKAGGESALMNQLAGPDTRRQAGETGSQMVRRLYTSELTLNSVAAVASSLGSRIQSGQLLTEQAGLGPHFFLAYPQFLGGTRVIDSNDYSRYHALEVKLDRRFADGYSYLIGYTLSRSKDTRSFDPTFTVYSTGSGQSASSTPFDINNRDLNYALSDFDRTHVFQAQAVYELPFGQGQRYGGSVAGWTDVLIGGWTLSGQLVAQSGRPMTVYAGSNTLTNVVQTPANCTGCSRDLGSVHEEVNSAGSAIVWYFNPDERSRFSIPGPGEFSNVGRNYFRGPGGWFLNLSLAKRTHIVGDQILEIRADSTNVFNNPTFGFPTLTQTSTLFGRIRDNVLSGSRKIMLGVKYYF